MIAANPRVNWKELMRSLSKTQHISSQAAGKLDIQISDIQTRSMILDKLATRRNPIAH
ncbi:hypothetical protein SPLC1_S230170 [Arthrospira platensis C1]|nr:hypothetical protein SPLC1_S230170 [Arthrospira platensis C1]